MTEEERAAALRRWLDSPSSGHPPELEADVVHAVSALRPDLAPPPRLTADDILASVSSGPLASGSAGAAPVMPSAEAGPEPLVMPANRPRTWWRSVGGAGGVGLVLAVAATFLLVVLPQSQEAPLAPAEESVAPNRAEAEPASTPARQAAASSATEGRAVEELGVEVNQAVEQQNAPKAPAASPPPPPPPPSAVALGAGSTTPRAAAPLIPELGDEVLVAGGDLTTAAGEGKEVRAAEAAPAVQTRAPADRELDGMLDAVADLGELDDAQDQRASAREETLRFADEEEPVEEAEAADDFGRYDIEDDLAVGGAVAPARTESASRARPRSEPERKRNKSAAAPAQEMAPSASPEPVDATGSTGEDLAVLRAAAIPSGSGGRAPKGIVPAVMEQDAAAMALATAAESRGDRRAAGDALAARVVPPAALGQARAVSAARHYLAAGDPAAAAGVAQAGLALGSTSSTDRAWLLVLYGDALQRLGDPSGAADAYRAAALAD
ncbi:MAG: hypothetical protein ACI8PZ_002497 [Myxococcota bacterium]|jgi:hypothetical protein